MFGYFYFVILLNFTKFAIMNEEKALSDAYKENI